MGHHQNKWKKLIEMVEYVHHHAGKNLLARGNHFVPNPTYPMYSSERLKPKKNQVPHIQNRHKTKKWACSHDPILPISRPKSEPNSFNTKPKSFPTHNPAHSFFTPTIHSTYPISNKTIHNVQQQQTDLLHDLLPSRKREANIIGLNFKPGSSSVEE
ncbi:hypothetical protein H5410_028643 [Solanum commersonii]|uniref:Uncharacterized protein n=1 Tax=Solanum commersonii TaxID=4109 RepID=A0A9J5Z5H9_SOLCO|nr:hypothetical protein H5410_028643 [Solanum commersonii]